MKKKKINFEKRIKKIYQSIYFKISSGTIGFILLIVFGYPSIANYLEAREPIDITGEWKMEFQIKDSSYSPYIGIESTYKIYFFQKNQEIHGNGESWEFNSNLNYDAHRPIIFEGKIDKYDIYSNYTLYGKERTTYGTITLKLKHDGDYMEGVFSGTGAAVAGDVKAYKL